MTRLVSEPARGLCQSRRHEVPDGTADTALVGIDGAPHLVEHTATVASHRYILVHERRAHVAIAVAAYPEVEGQRRRVARADDVLSGMAVGIAAVHPPARVVVFASFGYHLADVRPLAALVAGAPEEHCRLVAVAQHHAAYSLAVHRYEALVARHPLGGMGLNAGLVDDVQTIAGGILQIARHGRIVARAHTVEAELLQDGHVLLHQFVRHGVAVVGVLHVRALGVHLQRFAVQVENVVAHLGLLEAHVLTAVLCRGFRQAPACGGIHEIHLEFIQVRGLGRPFQGIADVLAHGQRHCPLTINH